MGLEAFLYCGALNEKSLMEWNTWWPVGGIVWGRLWKLSEVWLFLEELCLGGQALNVYSLTPSSSFLSTLCICDWQCNLLASCSWLPVSRLPLPLWIFPLDLKQNKLMMSYHSNSKITNREVGTGDSLLWRTWLFGFGERMWRTLKPWTKKAIFAMNTA